MTPHEVLGVRPNASRDEIELAFRSRRSQYHPDKYSGMDAETLKWATTQMQEINAAYSALSSPEHEGESIESDSRSTASAPGASEARGAPAPETTVSLGQLLRHRLAPYAGFSRIFFAPRIPTKKLNAAMGSYAGDIEPGEVLVLIDTTVFGGAKEGAILTESRIRAKELMSACADFAWIDIQELDLRGTSIRINGHQALDATMVDKSELVRLVGVLREFLLICAKAGTSKGQAASPAAGSSTPWANPALCEEVFADAVRHLIDLSELLQPREEEAGAEWLDRDTLARFLDSAQQAIQDPSKARLAYRYIVTVGSVCESAAACLRGTGRVDPALARGRLDDPIPICELRKILAAVL